jgi:methylmalonyl-CoA mutase
MTAFFLNAAIDQQCELYIKANMDWKTEVNKKIAHIYQSQMGNCPRNIIKRPTYQGELGGGLPEGNDGLGLNAAWVLRATMVLPAEVYKQIKVATVKQSARHGTSRYFKRGPGTKYLYFFYRVLPAGNGRCASSILSTTMPCATFYSVSISVATTLLKQEPTPSRNWRLHLSNGFTLCGILPVAGA